MRTQTLRSHLGQVILNPSRVVPSASLTTCRSTTLFARSSRLERGEVRLDPGAKDRTLAVRVLLAHKLQLDMVYRPPDGRVPVLVPTRLQNRIRICLLSPTMRLRCKTYWRYNLTTAIASSCSSAVRPSSGHTGPGSHQAPSADAPRVPWEAVEEVGAERRGRARTHQFLLGHTRRPPGSVGGNTLASPRVSQRHRLKLHKTRRLTVVLTGRRC